MKKFFLLSRQSQDTFLLHHLRLKYSNFINGLLFSWLGLFVVGFAGLGINLTIGYFYNLDSLGKFNITFVIYNIFSQIVTGGIQLSVLSYMPNHIQDKISQEEILCSGLILTFVFSILACISLYSILSFEQSGRLNPILKLSIIYSLPALPLFSINKIFVACINGLQQVKTLAAVQTFRFIIAGLSIVALSLCHANSYKLMLAFFISELILAIFLINYFFLLRKYKFFCVKKTWLKKHAKFSCKAFITGFLNNLIPKLDILIAGIFLSPAIVGVYSFITIITEAITQVLLVIQINVTSQLTRYAKNRQFNRIKFYFKKNYILLLLLAIGISIGILIAFPYLAKYFLHTTNLECTLGLHILLILCIGLVLRAPYIPLAMIFNQAGYPMAQTIFSVYILLINFTSVFILTFLLGAIGAAIGVSLTLVLSNIILKKMCNRVLAFTF